MYMYSHFCSYNLIEKGIISFSSVIISTYNVHVQCTVYCTCKCYFSFESLYQNLHVHAPTTGAILYVGAVSRNRKGHSYLLLLWTLSKAQLEIICSVVRVKLTCLLALHYSISGHVVATLTILIFRGLNICFCYECKCIFCRLNATN